MGDLVNGIPVDWHVFRSRRGSRAPRWSPMALPVHRPGATSLPVIPSVQGDSQAELASGDMLEGIGDDISDPANGRTWGQGSHPGSAHRRSSAEAPSTILPSVL